MERSSDVGPVASGDVATTESVNVVSYHDSDSVLDSMAIPEWSWLHLATGTAAFLCCPFPCGIVSLLSALLSYTDYRVMEFDAMRRKRRLAMRCGVVAILCGAAWTLFFWFGVVLFLQQYVERQKLIMSQQAELRASIANRVANRVKA